MLKVSWIRSQDLHILTVNRYVFTGDSRFHIIHENPENWTLKLDDVRLEDNGIYECQVSTQPITSFSVYLSVSAGECLAIKKLQINKITARSLTKNVVLFSIISNPAVLFI